MTWPFAQRYGRLPPDHPCGTPRPHNARESPDTTEAGVPTKDELIILYRLTGLFHDEPKQVTAHKPRVTVQDGNPYETQAGGALC